MKKDLVTGKKVKVIGTEEYINTNTGEIEEMQVTTIEERDLMEKIYTTMDLSIRAYDKIIKVARTIADLKQHEKIQQGDIAEAVSYRPVLFK